MTDRPTEEVATPSRGRASMTADQIQAYSVDAIQPLTAPIELAEPDPAWPALFDREEARIRFALGDRVVRLEHTGSTSVPGLAAKACIDITMTVADVLDEPAYVPDLEAAGYRLVIREHEPEWYDHRVFKGPDTNVNLHVFSAGCRELDRMVGFRDWLRSHPEDRELYEATKRDLVMRDWAFVQNYADAKGEVVEQIATRAGIGGPHPGWDAEPYAR
ncbi:MAG: GrpB family protein [Chloroflexota bacterium]|nr:GrpB family protein [Chloroflexota bacterium]